ncbi:hypothetical protein AMECASPLE_022890 [Ameca splendens]|uniref:GTP-eEF1A C-terminal domain-containing protein n=1 Tax=Ameca splendens TaxID=208324 RepID=A0ABV0XH09_9TELE
MALICLVDKKTGEKSKTRPRFVKQDQVCIARLRAAGIICLETFKDFPQMGRFTLRDEGEEVSAVFSRRQPGGGFPTRIQGWVVGNVNLGFLGVTKLDVCSYRDVTRKSHQAFSSLTSFVLITGI